MARLIKRGDVWLVNLEPGFGREIHKKRPAVVISVDSVNQETSNVIVVPASSRVLSPQVDIVSIGLREGVVKPSVLLPVLIRSIDQDRLIKKVGKLSKSKLLEVEDSVRLVLGLSVDN
jgi:mRNA interferase MazF